MVRSCFFVALSQQIFLCVRTFTNHLSKNRRKLFKLNILWEMKKVEESFE